MALYDRDPVYQQAFKLVDYTPARHVNIKIVMYDKESRTRQRNTLFVTTVDFLLAACDIFFMMLINEHIVSDHLYLTSTVNN